MTTKSWIIFTAICVLLFGGLLFWSQRERVDVSDVNTNAILTGSDASGGIGDHVKGNKDAKVILVEYGDFQCPGCAGAYPTVKSLVEKYGDHMAVVFRHFPLTSIHPNARAASAAAVAASLQGEEKFWSMHDLLFENQSAWQNASPEDRTELFTGYAAAADVNEDEFTTALAEQSSQINRKISFDQALGRKLNITGTPSFFLNGKQLTSEQIGSEEAFEKAITDALREAGVTPEDAVEDEKQ